VGTKALLVRSRPGLRGTEDLEAGMHPTCLECDSQVGALMVLAFEDVHWADEATLDLLRFLGRRISKERALLPVTLREEEAEPSGSVAQGAR
jgi:hypothetical protein